MAQIRICDRCGARVSGVLDAEIKSVVVPAASPATNHVDTDTNVTIGMQRGSDLCDPCQVSALVELVVTRLGPTLTPALLAAIASRVAKAGPIVVPVPLPVVAVPVVAAEAPIDATVAGPA
jgi:hypothetical protein